MSTTAADIEALQERIRLAPWDLIGQRIKEARLTAKAGGLLTLDELGNALGGVTRQHLIKLEKGQHKPRASMLLRLSEALGRSVDWFLDPDDPTPFRGGSSGA
jgi:transcriptional regulator with XRE-family HTH domain